MKRAIGLPVTTLARRSKSMVFALRSPPVAAGHIHVPESERRAVGLACHDVRVQI